MVVVVASAHAGLGVPGRLHGELEPRSADCRERSGSRVLRGGWQALLLQVSLALYHCEKQAMTVMMVVVLVMVVLVFLLSF